MRRCRKERASSPDTAITLAVGQSHGVAAHRGPRGLCRRVTRRCTPAAPRRKGLRSGWMLYDRCIRPARRSSSRCVSAKMVRSGGSRSSSPAASTIVSAWRQFAEDRHQHFVGVGLVEVRGSRSMGPSHSAPPASDARERPATIGSAETKAAGPLVVGHTPFESSVFCLRRCPKGSGSKSDGVSCQPSEGRCAAGPRLHRERHGRQGA